MNTETENKPKRKIGKFLKRVMNSTIVRAVVKSIPFGDVVYDVAENISHEIAVKNEIAIVEKPHNWLRILITILCLSGIVYAFITHEITIDELIHKLNTLI